MYQGTQCPNQSCLGHARETFYDQKNGKRWEIERCKRCKYNFDIEEYKGSMTYFNDQYFKQFGRIPPK